jgi:hypothetical protein
VLDELLEAAAIPADTSDAAKARFTRLHEALLAAMGREKHLLQEAKMLKRQVDVSGQQMELRVLVMGRLCMSP